MRVSGFPTVQGSGGGRHNVLVLPNLCPGVGTLLPSRLQQRDHVCYKCHIIYSHIYNVSVHILELQPPSLFLHVHDLPLGWWLMSRDDEWRSGLPRFCDTLRCLAKVLPLASPCGGFAEHRQRRSRVSLEGARHVTGKRFRSTHWVFPA